MTRFVPRAQAPISAGISEPVDTTWYSYLRSLGIDLDAVVSETDALASDVAADIAALAAHAASIPPHGIALTGPHTLAFGSNTIAHGLGRTPVGHLIVADDYYPVWVEAYHNTTQAISSGGTNVAFNTERFDLGGNFASNTFTAPRTGAYQIACFANFDNALNDGKLIYSQLNCSSLGVVYTGFTTTGAGSAYCSTGASPILNLASGETVSWAIDHNDSSARNLRGGYDDCRIAVRSFGEMSVAYGATNLTIISQAARTVSIWVW